MKCFVTVNCIPLRIRIRSKYAQPCFQLWPNTMDRAFLIGGGGGIVRLRPIENGGWMVHA